MPALAQARGIGAAVAGPAPTPQKWAIIIGVGDYQDAGIGDLPNAVNDARAVRDMLVSMPEGFPEKNVMLLADGEVSDRLPTRNNIIRFLDARLKLAGPQDTVLVYFAGHGITEAGALYLMASDSGGTTARDTGLAFARLEESIRAASAQKRVLILDACHSGAGRANAALSTHAVKELERASKGIVTLASCSGEEKSHEMPETGHGAFTHFLLEALTGKGDGDNDGMVSATEAAKYTWNATRLWASEKGLTQTPWRKEEVFGDIILAKTGGHVPSKLLPGEPATSPPPNDFPSGEKFEEFAREFEKFVEAHASVHINEIPQKATAKIDGNNFTLTHTTDGTVRIVNTFTGSLSDLNLETVRVASYNNTLLAAADCLDGRQISMDMTFTTSGNGFDKNNHSTISSFGIPFSNRVDADRAAGLLRNLIKLSQD